MDEKKAITFRCIVCRDKFSITADLDEQLELSCRKCSMKYQGPARAFSRLPREGYLLKVPGKMGTIKNLKLILEW